MKKAIVSVINDLSTDQRVHKVCTSLQAMGYDVTLVGRKQRKSLPLQERAYKTKRMFLLFENGPLFYLEYQKRLFWYLIFHKADVLVSNDLDTLLPNFLVSKLKGGELVYDSHEIFCEVPELQNNPTKKNIWKSLERWIFPKLKHVFTVNDSIAKIYSEEYKVPVQVIRNIPPLVNQLKLKPTTKQELGIPQNKKIIVLQGAGINIDRGAEEAVEAMQYVNDAVLMIVGSGDVITLLHQMVEKLNLSDKAIFVGKVPFEKLLQYTHHADLGLTLDKDTNINYRYSLPNKLFDYIHAGVPVLASGLVEIKNIIDQYKVGDCIQSHDPKHIADKINSILNNENQLQDWKKNCKIAAENLNWEKEEKLLTQVYASFLLK
ncbi:MAG: glycosyltransferase [Bacteroidetes bacterium]|nr:glycosyltransferase [Bacteroidota bacterium]